MKIIVGIKQVPLRDSAVHIDTAAKWFDEESLGFEINEPDAYALEEALQLKEKHGGEVIALCLGPDRAVEALHEALAKGADRAIHITCDDLATLDTLSVARRLVDAVKPEKPDLILTGLQSDDLGLGQTAEQAPAHHHRERLRVRPLGEVQVQPHRHTIAKGGERRRAGAPARHGCHAARGREPPPGDQRQDGRVDAVAQAEVVRAQDEAAAHAKAQNLLKR